VHNQMNQEIISRANELLDVVLVGQSVCLTFAQTLNGCLASSEKKPLQISCTESMLMTHVMRRRFQAIMVGRNTLISDDPKLTARGVPGDTQPIPIIVGRCTRDDFVGKNVLNHPNGPPIVVTNVRGDEERIKGLKAMGLRVVELDQDSTMVCDLKLAWTLLQRDCGISTLMVEGGVSMIDSMLSLADLVIVTISPVYIDSTTRISSSVTLHPLIWQAFGTDMILAAIKSS
jgi:riboflavin-specific deaminase-like protein